MPTNKTTLDIPHLQEALHLASLRRGFCAPNPSVGAVIVKEGKVIARGYHWASGHPHAEVHALGQLETGAAQGATLYVSLEPCCHFGKTPPCTQAIIDSGITRVVYGLRDPNPVVAGKGEQALLAAGISCQELELPEVLSYYRSYIHWQHTARPWVTAKLALSLDGKIAGPNGQPMAITGSELAAYTQHCRKHSDAILTTAKTIRFDNPQMNARLGDQVWAKPVYILDRLLTTPLDARIFQTSSLVTLFHQEGLDTREFIELGARCISINLNLLTILKQIGKDGIHDLWVEAGGQCFQALWKQGFINRGLIYLGSTQLGTHAQSAFTPDFDIFKQAGTMRWKIMGSDAMCEVTCLPE